MKRYIRLCRWVYGASLRLYPGAFQAQFADEMQAVFAELLDQAASRGGAGVIRPCLKELTDLPASLLREHYRHIYEANMNALRFTNHAKRYGALGFGIAFAIAKSGGLAWARGGLADLAIYVLAGVLGGALFGLATRSRKQLGLLALVGALAFAVGHLVTRYLWAIWGVRVLPEGPAQNPAGAALIFTLAYLAEPTIVGALAGLGIGTIQKNVRQAIRITAITGAGFALGQIIGFGVSLGLWAIIQALASWRLAFNGQLDPWVVGFGNGGWLVAASIVAGVIGGAAAGNILKRSAPERSPMAPG